jgi:hypothetical protein
VDGFANFLPALFSPVVSGLALTGIAALAGFMEAIGSSLVGIAMTAYFLKGENAGRTRQVDLGLHWEVAPTFSL